MKKVFALIMAAMLALSLASCGEKDPIAASSAGTTGEGSSEAANVESTPDETESSTDTSTEQEASKEPAKTSSKAPAKVSSQAPAKTSSVPTSTGKFKSIEAYLNDPSVKPAMDAMIEEMKATGLNMTITGEGNKMIYTYAYTQQMPEGTGEMLKAAMEEQRPIMEGVAASLKAAVDVADPVVVVKYLNADGSVLATIEFTAK